MDSSEPVVVVKSRAEARARRYTVLSGLFTFISIGALVILSRGWNRWQTTHGLVAWAQQVRFEEWIALGLLAAHGCMALLAFRYRARRRSLDER